MSRAAIVPETQLARFAELEQRLAAGRASWVHPVRRAGLERFAAFGYPGTHLETWKRTDVEPMTRASFAPASRAGVAGVDAETLRELHIPELPGTRLVFVNGHLVPSLFSRGDLPRDVKLLGLSEALESERQLLETHLSRHAAYEAPEQAFTALNTAFLEEGAVLIVPRGRILAEPIHLVFVTSSRGEPIVMHPRVLIVAEEESQATVVETYAGLGSAPYFTNAVTEIALGAGAVVTHCKVQREAENAFHIGTLQVDQGRASHFTSHVAQLGGALARNEVHVTFRAEGGECTLNGLYAIGGQQHSDNQTDVDHAKPHCTSSQLYKGILTGAARGVFNGRILVRKDAQKTDARQTNRNLLLSESALVDTKPQLEIFADDVRCTHGATIGRLDEDAIFYLRARGIGEEAARRILTHAFAGDVLSRLKIEPLRASLVAALRERLSETIALEGAV